MVSVEEWLPRSHPYGKRGERAVACQKNCTENQLQKVLGKDESKITSMARTDVQH